MNRYAFKNAALAAMVGPVFDRIAGSLAESTVKAVPASDRTGKDRFEVAMRRGVVRHRQQSVEAVASLTELGTRVRTLAEPHAMLVRTVGAIKDQKQAAGA